MGIRLLGNNYIFQQDGAQTVSRLTPHACPNSPDINPLDYCVWGVMLAAYQKHKPNPTTKAQLREVLQEIWDNMSQDCINKAVLGVRKRLRACVQADGGHFEHVL